MRDEHTLPPDGLRKQQEQLLAIIESISSELELTPLLARIVHRACELVRAECGVIALYDQTHSTFQTKAVYGMPSDELGAEFASGVGLAGQVLLTRQPVRFDRYGELANPTQPGMLEYAVVGVPILWKRDLMGFLGLGSPPPRRFTGEDVRLLEILSRYAAVAIANARLFDAEQRARLEAESQARKLARSNTLLNTLGHVAMKFSSAKDPEELMRTLGQELRSFGVYCVTALLTPDSHELEIHFASLDMPALSFAEKLVGLKLSGFRIRRDRWQIFKQLVDERQPVFVDDSFSLSAALLPRFPRPLVKRVLGLSGVTPQTHAVYAPLLVKSEVIGVLGMWGEDLLEEDLPAAAVFAGQVAAAIENRRQQALLYEGAHQLAVLEERRRLARDLHDSVTQLIFSITLIAQSISSAWRRDPAEGEKRINRLLELSQQTLVEMRALLAELRPTHYEADRQSAGLAGALAKHVASLLQDGLQVNLDAHTYAPQSPALEEHLFRIAQEALHNVVKHAHATEVDLFLGCSEHEVLMRITDKGVGFARNGSRQTTADPNVASNGFGLTNMQERAASLGGTLQVLSELQKGTTVEVRIPIHRE